MGIDTKIEVESVIDRMKSIRKEKKLSQLDLALESGISQGFIASIETHQKVPTISTIIKIADALGVSPVAFFSDGINCRVLSRKKINTEQIAAETLEKILPTFSKTLKREIETALKK